MITGAPQPLPPEEPPDDREAKKVLGWRVDFLVAAGYDHEAAVLLAKNLHVDLHVAEELLLNGCPIDTALLILF